MPRPRNTVPTYSHHTATGQAYARIPDGAGGRRCFYLGRYGTEESREAYRRLLAELAAREPDAPGEGTPAPPVGPDPLVVQVLHAFIRHADSHYRRPDGSRAPELAEYKALSKLVRGLYGRTPAREFGPLALKAVRAEMVKRGWCRVIVNQRVSRVKHVFKWAASEQLVPVAVYQALATVAGLQRGRANVRESEPVRPVDDAAVGATVPHLNRHARGLVEFQRLTGCRPGEACAVRRADIDTGGPVWLYRPTRHKTAWRGKSRVVAIGPMAQALIREFLTPDIGGYLFSPRRAVEEVRAERAAKRKTPKYPSHMRRNVAKRKPTPKRVPADHYTPRSYSVAVGRAVDRANREREKQAKKDGREFTTIPHWHPNQLRHTFATKVRKQHGLEAAQVLLGHERADVTQIYAEKNQALAVEVGAKLG